MSSGYDQPRDYIFWQVEGNYLGIYTTKGDGLTLETKRGDLKPIDESVDQAILIVYEADPDPITKETDVPDIDKNLHMPLMKYIKSQLMLDRVANAASPDMSAAWMALANRWEADWRNELRTYATGRADKTGGVRAMSLPSV